MEADVKGKLRFLLWRAAVWMGWRFVEAGFALTMVATICAFAAPRHWAMDLLANGRPQFLVASLVVAVMFTCVKRWSAALLATGFALLNVAAMSSYFGSVVEKPVDGQPVFRLMSANVYQLSGLERDYGMLEPMLKAQPFDLVGLQEAGGIWQTMMPNWKGSFPQQSIETQMASHHELAFLGGASTMWREVKWIPLLGNDQWSRGLVLEMEWQGKTISVLMAHAYRPAEEGKLILIRKWQQSIVQWVGEKKAAGHEVIVMGDFNCTPWTALYQDFVKEMGLKEAGRGHLFAATWMPEWPHRMMIDHVFVSDGWRVVNWRVGEDFDSDHRPLMVDLQLK